MDFPGVARLCSCSGETTGNAACCFNSLVRPHWGAKGPGRHGFRDQLVTIKGETSQNTIQNSSKFIKHSDSMIRMISVNLSKDGGGMSNLMLLVYLCNRTTTDITQQHGFVRFTICHYISINFHIHLPMSIFVGLRSPRYQFPRDVARLGSGSAYPRRPLAGWRTICQDHPVVLPP